MVNTYPDRITITLTKTMADDLIKIADQKDCTVTSIVRPMIDAGIKKEQKKGTQS